MLAVSTAFLLSSSQLFAAPQPIKSLKGSQAKISASLALDLAATTEAQTESASTRTHRVIVSLDDTEFGVSSVREIMQNSTTLNRYRGFIRTQQELFASALAEIDSGNVLYRYENIPAVSMELTASQINAIAEFVSVTRLDKMEVYQKTDSEAHRITRVNRVHSRLSLLGEGITVAVIDDGIDSDHAAFGGESGFPTSRILGGRDFADNDANPRADCPEQSHGTSVSSIIAGNGGGITGVAPEANLVFLKIQTASDCGGSGLSGDIVGAIDWVVSNKDEFNISVLSMSFGGGSFDSVSSCEQSSAPLSRVLNEAEEAGIIAFAASGNNGLCEQMARPACVGSAISVGATYDADVGTPGFCVNANSCAPTQSNPSCSPSGLVAAFESSTAADQVTVYSNSASFLDILAPSNCAFAATADGGTTDCFGGTSAATPYAAGVAALVLEAAGGTDSLDKSEMLELLQTSGVPVVDGRNNRETPRVRASRAVRQAR